MSENFSMKSARDGEIVKIKLSGIIDEDVKFDNSLDANAKEYHFDFSEVTMINSCGIREWISFIQNISSSIKLRYYNCPKIIVDQLNMVGGFIKKGAAIETLYAPYYCNTCDKEQSILLSSSEITNHKAPTKKCDKCGEDLEFDSIEEKYFSFID